MCFKCKQPYSLLHECPNQSLITLTGDEDEYVNKDGVLAKMEEDEEPSLSAGLDEAHFSRMEIPLNLVGCTRHQRSENHEIFQQYCSAKYHGTCRQRGQP